ncbi:rRNA maturation RNase YbeY [Cohaesibacter gelatinilyticus]|uniref:Endoribonuclease YbeY n=1 Tax=Cohaesibacter gelatinilyticus TaxID=372072 RepID=A0A285PDZ9_9HYPH|nr:rRNA maturation RNase YbeY [Cohaesibacter gelatinilyticus]SNZ19974.1 probable rRNA maturation factor [Cohaesibacter gelatinilyticus]HAT86623.1 rRNA maturation RNase YbeY [Hyphomicrobiales bacterium]
MSLAPLETPLEKDSLIEADNWNRIENLELLISRAIDTAHAYAEQVEKIEIRQGSEVSLVFSDNETVRELNAAHRGKDQPTNVLSFPIDEEADPLGPLLGDIVFAYETVEREAEELAIEFSAHLTHLCVHGFLHLLGYDHIEWDEAEKMEAVEIAILAQLGIDNPYAGSDPLPMPD